MKGTFTNPTNHLIEICPTIIGKIGMIPQNAKETKITESRVNAGIELNTFLI